jgi:hypothetical protein
MAEITTAGYQDIRDHIEATWLYVELRDGSGDPITADRLVCGTDSRVNWTHAPSAQTLEITTIITGEDADIDLPTTFKYSAIFKVATAGSSLSTETFTQFTIEATSDQLTIKHRIEVPRVI